VINQIVDGEHYIKVKPDLSDLVDKLEWAAANDEEAKRIAMNGRQFSKKMFDSQPMQMYNSLLFMEYQRLFK
jgi:glycosyltransferase involved in cell wall biosynthesis